MLKNRKVFIVLSLALVFALSGTVSALADELVVYSSVDEENARNI
ncbi:MAG: ABC transporter substrate-binding protein, partial [Synergistales bacterium]|nr:ABC transporter substrate-binding protein [Synergistales bacterium]